MRLRRHRHRADNRRFLRDAAGLVFFPGTGEKGVKALQERHALQGNQFLRLKERPPEIDPALFARMRRVAGLGELKGMGLWNALALEELGIKGAEDLAGRNPAELRVQLGALRRNVRLEEVAVWIREAKRIHPGSE